jgi:DNA-binding PadR family transcriptional regulator
MTLCLGFIQKYDLLVSPGTVYALLYSLEREGLIKGKVEERKRVYELTNSGLENANLLKREIKEVTLFLANLGA